LACRNMYEGGFRSDSMSTINSAIPDLCVRNVKSKGRNHNSSGIGRARACFLPVSAATFFGFIAKALSK
jgi:hypothetical protein